MPKKLSELIAHLPDVVRVTGDVEITAPVVEADADLQPGGVFVARPGRSSDGHDFIPRAIEKGAAAIVGERDIGDLSIPYVQVKNSQEATGFLAAAYHDFPSRKLVLIGVTGTDGKTTTSTLIHSILQVATEGKAGLISTVNAVLGDTVADTGLHVTTPGAPQVQELLARMVANGLTHCILEMTSHGLAQGRLNGVDIDVAVMTNVTHEHLDYHGLFEAYRAAKGRMFEMLKYSAPKPNQPKISIINNDDPNADFFAAFPADKVIRYAYHRQKDADLKIAKIMHDASWSIVFTQTYTGDALFGTQLVGEFNMMNALAAAATCLSLGVDLQSVSAGIAAVKAVPGRMERIDEGQNFTAIVDFAHTPNALENALKAAKSMLPEGKRLIAVFGSAGLRDREKRRMMAEVSARTADFTVLTAEDPRTESLDMILEAMVQGCISQGGVEGKTFIRVPDRGEALFRACQMAEAGDIVIACGKGHEQSMCFGTIEYPWDDRDGLRAALRGVPLRTLPTSEGLK
ncbi:MAG: UDP-N-acetylmuramoyl-L-alanyl-D-glutamate--2,6-diaminopimelate ligase [Anaerolineae bacterium]|nr:UDP-N-acetylmuramoyl-L-alanyl-D-glutamate--2,6-diaminopimelate ligase [Anaerolineae bacterium]